ncbi:MAG: hypothetical protein F4Y16_09140 [Holophagales bacterium]|nr:hypothetical protein [Holophagales bacterium]MYH24288.1 hypothetical protein [Holophagales bacterium]
MVNRLWQNAPDIQPDCVSDYVAIQAWPWIPSGYQLVEQSLKALIAARQGTPLTEVEKGHHLAKLFGRLDSGDKRDLSHAFESFVGLHDYITVRTIGEFLDSVGRGYTQWRYMLLDGAEGIPPNHIGSLLEIANAAISRLRSCLDDKPVTFPTVMQRIRVNIDSDIGHACNRLNRGDEQPGELERRYENLREEVLKNDSLRLAIAAHLANTDNPRLGTQPRPNPWSLTLPELPPAAEVLVGIWKRSSDRKNLLAYFRKPAVQHPRVGP